MVFPCFEGVWEKAEESTIRLKASDAKLLRHTHPPRKHDDGGEAATVLPHSIFHGIAAQGHWNYPGKLSFSCMESDHCHGTFASA